MSWLALVTEADDEYYKDPWDLEYSNGKRFYNTDKTNVGVYANPLTFGATNITFGTEELTF